MAGSSFGNNFTVTTWGESHGKALGAVIDGCPAGIPLSEKDIQVFLDRRKPGQSDLSTQRNETDQCEILSGTFEGLTTGTPISVIVYNKDQRSKDYTDISQAFRPGHADYTYFEKYGIRDYRGGGRSSGRETLGRVMAGAVASKILSSIGVTSICYSKSVGPVEVSAYDEDAIFKNPVYMPDMEAAKKAEEYIRECKENKESVGGVVECRIKGLPVGIGEPVFEKTEALLAQAVMSIGAVKGFEIGDGFLASEKKGSENNDSFYMDGRKVRKSTNHSGGVLGGITDGDEIVFRAAIKPTPSISLPQNTVTSDGAEVEMVVCGRHDPVIVPRAVVVVESMALITLTDLLFSDMSSRISKVEKLYV
ncbi:MAG: chorismate synthase [Lachnospiraceae bacterium]|nr:chorismate synthase [Lachnospiraceae bacterium]